MDEYEAVDEPPMQSVCLTHSAFLLVMLAWIIRAKIPRTFLKSWTRVSRLQRGKKLSQFISAKVSERYIQALHDMCSAMLRFCFLKYVLYVNKSQDLH